MTKRHEDETVQNPGEIVSRIAQFFKTYWPWLSLFGIAATIAGADITFYSYILALDILTLLGYESDDK